jgi:hypothetical protein
MVTKVGSTNERKNMNDDRDVSILQRRGKLLCCASNCRQLYKRTNNPIRFWFILFVSFLHFLILSEKQKDKEENWQHSFHFLSSQTNKWGKADKRKKYNMEANIHSEIPTPSAKEISMILIILCIAMIGIQTFSERMMTDEPSLF